MWGMWALFQQVSAGRAESQGDLVRTVSLAVQTYATENHRNILEGTAVAGVSTPLRPTLAELRALGYLSSTFSDRSLYGTGYRVQLALSPSGCLPPLCDLTGLVSLDAPLVGASGRVEWVALGTAAQRIGGAGGFSSATTPTLITGLGASWSATNPMGSVAGILAARVSYNSREMGSMMRRDGSLPMTDTLRMGGNMISGLRTIASASIGQPCGTSVSNGDVASGDSGRLITCQAGLWAEQSVSPKMYRYAFTSDSEWVVPQGIKSGFVTMAGGGGSGGGWRVIAAITSGPSGGFVFSHPLNFNEGERVKIVVGKGGRAYSPYATNVVADPGPPYYVHNEPAGDDGLGGYPGTSSKLVALDRAGQPTLLECTGGSGGSFWGVDSYDGGPVAGNRAGALVGSGNPRYSSPNRAAVVPAGWETGDARPGRCGTGGYGEGVGGDTTYAQTSMTLKGGRSPFNFGSGGAVSRWGCFVTKSIVGTCVYPEAGTNGVVFIDVLY